MGALRRLLAQPRMERGLLRGATMPSFAFRAVASILVGGAVACTSSAISSAPPASSVEGDTRDASFYDEAAVDPTNAEAACAPPAWHQGRTDSVFAGSTKLRRASS